MKKLWFWEDASDRIVQIKVTTTPAKGVPLDGTTQFSRYDVPLVVTPPAASEVKAEPTALLQNYLSNIDAVIQVVY